MRKSFFRSFIADPVCASSDPGHHVDMGRYFMAVVKSSVTIPVRAAVRDDGLVRLDANGDSAELWNHRPGDVDLALLGTHGAAEWAPEWRVLLVPGVCRADERTVFTLAYPGERTECAIELSPAGPRLIRRY
ncbi:MAG: hypothetical protein QOC63_4863 [Mycobacterium sp.]|nr:hypothetical protein [Mycobacterium sp.]